ncbi:MAG TPA: aminotransferase class V-fold PLP-dependent enzyme [Candidatus Eisenbacteria bacterium]|nr:aminotransferase class V-fold PLP-dependent enzyme [Candidatus Eisenbacteria bacterium]
MTFGRSMLGHWLLDPSITYLNHGTVGCTPRRVLEAQQSIREEIERQPSRFLLRELNGLGTGVPAHERSRLRAAAREVAAFVRARPEDVALVDNATTGANAILQSIDLEAGDEIVVTGMGYGGVVRAAAYHARRRGARLRVAEIPYPDVTPERVLDVVDRAIGPKCRLVVVDHVSSLTALVFPVREIAERCRRKGVPILVDGAHAPGAIDVDVPSLRVDYYTGNLHKWAFAPRPCGLLWASPERQAALHPPVISWGLDEGFLVEFDWMSTRDPSAMLAAPEGIRMMRDLGVEAMRGHNHALARDAARLLASAWGTDHRVPEEMMGTMCVVPLPASFGSTADDATRIRDRLLFEERIEVQLHDLGGRLWARVSAQVYNEIADVERLAEAVRVRSR